MMTLTMVTIWVLSSALASPSLVFSTTVTYHDDGDNTATACMFVWPDGKAASSFNDHVYQVTVAVG